MTSLENTSLNARKVKDAINILVAWDLFARRQSYLYRGVYGYHIFDSSYTSVDALEARLYNLTAPDIDEFVKVQIGAISIRFMVLGGHPKGVNNSFEHLAYIALLRKYPILVQYGWHFEEPTDCSSYSIPCVSGIYAMLQKLAKDQQFDQFFDEFNAFCNKHKLEVSEYVVYSILVNTFTQVDTATSEKPVELPKTVIRDCIEFYRNWQEKNRQELEAERQKMSEALQQEKQRKMAAEKQKWEEQQQQEKLAAAKEAAEKHIERAIEFLKTAEQAAAQKPQSQKKTRSGKSY